MKIGSILDVKSGDEVLLPDGAGWRTVETMVPNVNLAETQVHWKEGGNDRFCWHKRLWYRAYNI